MSALIIPIPRRRCVKIRSYRIEHSTDPSKIGTFLYRVVYVGSDGIEDLGPVVT